MSEPESFILTTDYGTLKNDASGSVSVTMPPIVLTANQLYTVTTNIEIGTLNASSRVRIASSKDGGLYYVGSMLVATRTGQIPGPFDVPYSVVGFTSRTSPTTVTATIAITNPYSDLLTMAAGNEVFTFELDTFLSPFVATS